MDCFFLRKLIRLWPGRIIGHVPKPSPQVLEGCGKCGEVGRLCKSRGFKRVLLVTDSTLFGMGFHRQVVDALEREHVAYTIFNDISSEPTVGVVDRGRRAARQSGAQCVIALGGGSVMDACKMMAAGMKLKYLPSSMLLQKLLFVPGGTVPLIALPTTAGTGAEVSVGAIVKNEDDPTSENVRERTSGAKCATVIVGLRVEYVVLDPDLSMRAPLRVAAKSAIDAMSHGIEGFVADVNVKEERRHYCVDCVKLAFANLPRMLASPDNVDARQALCRAAYYGGNSISNHTAGYVHAFAHTIGAYYHIDHGTAIAMCLIPVLRYQKPYCEQKYAQLAAYCGIVPSSADAFLAALERLVAQCGLHVPEICDEDFDALSHLVIRDSINYSAPMVLHKKEVVVLLKEIQGTRLVNK